MVGPPFYQEDRDDKLGERLARIHYYHNSFFFFCLGILHGESSG